MGREASISVTPCSSDAAASSAFLFRFLDLLPSPLVALSAARFFFWAPGCLGALDFFSAVGRGCRGIKGLYNVESSATVRWSGIWSYSIDTVLDFREKEIVMEPRQSKAGRPNFCRVSRGTSYSQKQVEIAKRQKGVKCPLALCDALWWAQRLLPSRGSSSLCE